MTLENVAYYDRALVLKRIKTYATVINHNQPRTDNLKSDKVTPIKLSIESMKDISRHS